MTRKLGLLIAIIGLVGCAKKDGPAVPAAVAPAGPAAVADAGAIAIAVADAAPAIDTASVKVPTEVLPGVLPIAAESKSPEAREKARALNAAGLKFHRKKKFDEAMAKYKEALALDPSEPFARYNLASALVSVGEPKNALKLLGEFRELGCAQCWNRLRRARQDAEWKPLWKDETFKQLTGESGKAPTAEVVSFHLSVADRDTDSPNNFAVNVVLEPPPGWVKAPKLEIVVTRKGKTIHKRKLDSDDFYHAWGRTEFSIPKGGPWQVALRVDGKMLASIKARRDQIGIQSLPDPVIRKVRRPRKVGRCDGAECPKFPALSADGKYLVHRVYSHLVSTVDMCQPPAAKLTKHQFLAADGPSVIGSRNLAGYRPLKCEGFGFETMKLSDGARATYSEEDETLTIETKSGKKVEDLPAEYIREYCVVAEHRVLVLVQYYQGTDCSDPTEDEITAIRY